MNQKLIDADARIDEWCADNGVGVVTICCEDDVRGFMLPSRLDDMAGPLSDFVGSLSLDLGLHTARTRVRSGTIYVLSPSAVSESTVESMVPPADRSRLLRRLDLAFGGGRGCTGPGCAPAGLPGRIDRRLADRLGYAPVAAVVAEALDGIAADHQPMDVMRQFRAALSELGLVDMMKDAGITNKLSPDKQTLHFYIADADGRNREIAGYELTELAEGNSMETAIKDLADLARMRAPGTTDRESQRVKDYETTIRNVAKSHSLEDRAGAAQGAGAAKPVPLEDAAWRGLLGR